VRGLVILRAFLSVLVHATSSTGDNDRGLSFILGKAKHNIILTSARSYQLTVELELWGRNNKGFNIQPLRSLVYGKRK